MTVRIGLLAASRIAQTAVVEPARVVSGVEIAAVASRSRDRAVDAAERWLIPRVVDSYEAMIVDENLDAVYIGTPAALHRGWAVAAIEAGKHVLCEKPFASNAHDALRIADAAAGADVIVMEAYHWRYHPLVSQMRSILDSGMLGTIDIVDARFEVETAAIPRSDIRWDLSLGGGAMMDIGCYPASWLRWLFNDEPEVESAEAVCPVPGIDGSMRVELSWPTGVSGSIFASMISETTGHTSSLTVVGSNATMAVENPVAPQWGGALEVRSASGTTDYPVLAGSTYESQLVAFRDAVVFGAEFPTTAADGVQTMRLVDACYRAAGLDVRPSNDDARRI